MRKPPKHLKRGKYKNLLVGRKLGGVGSGASLEDEGAEEAIPSEKPQSSELVFPRYSSEGRAARVLLEERTGGFSSLVSWSPALESCPEPAGGSPAGPEAAAGPAEQGKCLERLKSKIFPSLDSRALPPAPE